MKRLSPEAQSIVEYVLLVTLVAVGIIVMGPYVIRAVNAHLKSWDDVVEDSYSDPFIKGPHDFPPPECKCVDEKVGCGLGNCSATEMYYRNNCAPIGCQPLQDSCKVDDSCCEKGACGEGCPPGQRTVKQCGATPQPPTCQPDPGCPTECVGTVPDNAVPCPGDETGGAGLPWIPVGACTDRKCEAVCLAGFPYDPDLGRCQPPGCTVNIEVNDDCGFSACPSQCPYIVACDLVFEGSDCRACVSNNTSTGELYFQEGNDCSGSGNVFGSIKCSDKPVVLDNSNCALKKKSGSPRTQPIWTTDWQTGTCSGDEGDQCHGCQPYGDDDC